MKHRSAVLSYSLCTQFVMSSTCHIGPSHLPNIFHCFEDSRHCGVEGVGNAAGEAKTATCALAQSMDGEEEDELGD